MWLDRGKDLLGLLSRTSRFMRGQVPYEIPSQFLTASSEDSIIRKSISLLHALSTLLCLQGRQFPDANLPGLPPEERKAIFEAAIKTLVQLQSIDTDKLNLDCIDDKENFFQQRLDTLYEGYKRTEMKAIPKVHQLMEWMRENIPKDDKKPVIHHTDFRIPNMLFHPEQSQVLAVIDWEAASWGHPFEDLAYFCLAYHYPAELDIMPGFKVAYYSEGIPSEEAMLSLYCELTGYTLPLPNWTYFLALIFFRVVVNIQTVFAQLSAGGVDLPFSFKGVDDLLEPLVHHACKVVGLK